MAKFDEEGVHAKVDRARSHFADLYEECRGFIERDSPPFGISIPYFDSATEHYVCKAIITESPPVKLGVIVGDVIHNARSALDHLVWQLVLANGKTPTSANQWPIVADEAKWEERMKHHLKGARGKQRAVIRAGQPFHAGRQAALTSPAMLKRLSNTDKHQVVHATFGLILDPGEEVQFTVRSGPGRVVRSEVRHFGRFEHGAELLRTYVEGRTDETEVWMEGNGPVEMAFGDPMVTISQINGIIEWVAVAVRDVEATLGET